MCGSGTDCVCVHTFELSLKLKVKQILSKFILKWSNFYPACMQHLDDVLALGYFRAGLNLRQMDWARPPTVSEPI